MATEQTFPEQRYVSIESSELERLRVCEELATIWLAQMVQLGIKHRNDEKIIDLIASFLEGEAKELVQAANAKRALRANQGGIAT